MTTSKILAILHERSHTDRIVFKAKEQEKDCDVKIVTISVPFPDTELVCRDFKSYVPRFYDEKAITKAQSWIKNWSNRKIVDNKTFKELISYDGVSLWWFVEFFYFYSSKISLIAKYIEILCAVMEEEKPTKVIFAKDGSLFSLVLETFAKSNAIETLDILQGLSIRKVKEFFRSFLRISAKRKWKVFLTLKETLRSKWISLLNVLLKRRLGKTSGLPAVVLITPERFWREIIEQRTGKTKRGFLLTDSIIRKIAEKYRLIVVSVDPFFDKILGLKILLEEQQAFPEAIIKTPENWENKMVKDRVKEAKVKINETWKMLKASEDFQSSLSYYGIPLWGILQSVFAGIFSMSLPEAVRWIEIMKVMIDKEKPLVIVLPGEYCSFQGYSALIAGKKKNVPTVAIQHGVVTAHSLEYKMTKDEKGEDANSKLWVIPTKLAVYGLYTKKSLEGFLYPPNNIAITGHPDYDILFRLEKLLKKDEILKELGIDSHQGRIMTFTTQALWSMKSREALLRLVLDAAKKLEDTVLIIKPHPAEDENWHRSIIKEMKVKNTIVLDRHYNTTKALYVCDIMITSYSTTALEAMTLNKPVITLNLKDESELFPYAKSGAALGASNSEDLLCAIKSIFGNSVVQRELERARQKLIAEHLHKIDGRASERIVSLISQIEHSSNN